MLGFFMYNPIRWPSFSVMMSREEMFPRRSPSLVVIVNLSVLEDQKVTRVTTSDLLPHVFDVVEYHIIEGKVHRDRRKAQKIITGTGR
jgi:hypothetical protein